MFGRGLARDELWEVAGSQHGFVTAQQAAELGIGKGAMQMLVQRGTLNRAAFGVYRFPHYPADDADRYMLAMLWTRTPEACVSHETALDLYGISDVNPALIHVTVPKARRLRRTDGEGYVLHRKDLAPEQIGWWREVPTVTAATAISQCIAWGTPPTSCDRRSKTGTARVGSTPSSATVSPRRSRRGKASDPRASSIVP